MKKLLMCLLASCAAMPFASAEELVVCAQVPESPVYERDLQQVNFMARDFETVVPFQSFGSKVESEVRYVGHKDQRAPSPFIPADANPSLIQVINLSLMKTTIYVRAEFTDRDEEEADNNVGWIDRDLIKPKSQCANYKEPVDSDDVAESDEDKSEASKNSGLSDPNCCLFPMKVAPKESYTSGQRRFGSSRSKGARAHAAADLYQSQYQPVYAIAKGKVLRDRVPFYLGTNVTEIEHPGGFIARYGEMASPNIKKLAVGDEVKAGQLIGFIKKVNSRNVYSPMLHFELYTGTGSGPLTTKKGKFQRRSDLINPTKYLQQWETRM